MIKKYYNASLTVEATLVFPIFFFAVLVFLYLFQILYFQEHIQFALTETVEKTSKYAYIYENMLSSKETESTEGIKAGGEWIRNVMADGFVAGVFIQEVDTDMLDHTCIKGGYKGLNFLRSSVMVEEKEIDAVVEYVVNIKAPILAWISFPVCQRMKSRAFVGQSYAVKGKEDEEEEMVYITPTGKAYHQSKDCSYIKIILQSVTYSNLGNFRNDSGAKYYACERCIDANVVSGSTIYITSYGTRYHMVNNCPGIKRTVTSIPLSQIGDRYACSKCLK